MYARRAPMRGFPPIGPAAAGVLVVGVLVGLRPALACAQPAAPGALWSRFPLGAHVGPAHRPHARTGQARATTVHHAPSGVGGRRPSGAQAAPVTGSRPYSRVSSTAAE